MRHGQYRFIVGFLVLPLALYAIFVISPFVQAFYYSLTNWTGVSPQFEFIGLQNFQTLTQDSLFLGAVRNNLVLLVGMPLAVILLALFYAFLLNVGGSGSGAGVRGVRGSGFYKLAFFLPQVLSVPVIAVIWASCSTRRRRAWSTARCGASGSTWCCSTPPCRRSRRTCSRRR